MSKLIIRYPNNVIKEVEFDNPKFKIGTAPDNDLVLENEEVQAHQAEIDTVEGAFSIVDVSENKSTTVNGKKIERVNLNYGDRIAFGPVIGLFYPSKKEAVGDKTKLFLFLAAGGFVLILSIALMFYLTSRRISTVMTEQIGGTIAPLEEVRAKPRQGKVREEKPAKKSASGEEETEAVAASEPPAEEEGAAQAGVGPDRALTVPEPTPEQIRARSAVAIPGGIRGLFFKKRPVLAAETLTLPGEAPAGTGGSVEGGEGTAGGVAPSPAGSTVENAGALPARETGQAALPSSSAAGEEGATTETGFASAQGGEQVGEGGESAPEKKGFLARVFSPVTRLFGGGRTETAPEEEAPAEGFSAGETTSVGGTGGEGETGAGSSESASGVSSEAVPGLGSDIAKLVEPLSALRKLDIQELKTQGFNEKPVYNESELLRFKEKDVLGGTQLSKIEDINTTVLWEYPAGGEKRSPQGSTVTRTGAMGHLSGAKHRDVVYGTNNGVLVGLRGNNGSELFSRDIGKEHGGAFFEPLLGDLNGDGKDEIVVGFEKGKIVSYNRNVDQLWVYEGKGRITSLPALMDVSGDGVGDVIFSTLGMDLIAIDGKTGFELWRFFDATGETLSSPAGLKINSDSRTDLVFVTVNGFLYGVDGKTGWGLWKANISGRPSGGPAVGPIGEGKDIAIVTLTRNGMLSGHDRGGKPLFSYDMKSTFVTGPSLGDTDGDGKTEIVTADVQGVVRAVEGSTRREKWRFQSTAGTTLGRIALADVNGDGGMDVAFTTLSGVLTVLDGRNGTVIALHNIGDFSFATPLIADLNGDKKLEMVTAGRNGRVGSVQLADAAVKLLSLKKSSWLAVNRDGKNTGYSKFTFRGQGN